MLTNGTPAVDEKTFQLHPPSSQKKSVSHPSVAVVFLSLKSDD